MYNGPFRCCILLFHQYVINDALTCEQHFNAVELILQALGL